MSLRLIEIKLGSKYFKEARELLDDFEFLDCWEVKTGEGDAKLKILIESEHTEQLLDTLEKRFVSQPEFRVLVFTPEATLPRPDAEESEPEISEDKSSSRLSREEIYSRVEGSFELSAIYLFMVALSAVVAAIGLMKNSTAIVIGAMVIAPLLAPNVGLALSTTLADRELGKEAFKTLILALFLAMAVSILMGWFVVDQDVVEQGEIASRTWADYWDFALALAAGAAATLSFTTNLLSTALIGVMVAVALLPPVVVCGMTLGSGYLNLALGSAYLVLANIICINLAGVIAFLGQGIHPLRWWDAKKAKKASLGAVIIWSALLIILAFLIYFSG